MIRGHFSSSWGSLRCILCVMISLTMLLSMCTVSKAASGTGGFIRAPVHKVVTPRLYNTGTGTVYRTLDYQFKVDFLDNSGKPLVLDWGYYNFCVQLYPSAPVSGVWQNGGGVTSNCRYYVIVEGEKRYISSSVFGFDIGQIYTASFIVGFEIEESITNITVPSVNSWMHTSVSLDGLQYLVTPISLSGASVGEIQIDNSIQEGNQLQQQGNQLQEKSNNLQAEANKTGKNIFDKISDFFGGFFEGIINAFKSLFIPEDSYFSSYFQRLNDFFSKKLGMLYAPIDMFLQMLNSVKDAGTSQTGITFPGLKWGDTYLIPAQNVSLSTIAKDFPGLQEKIYFITNVIMIGAVLLLLQNKLKEVLKR